MQNTFLEVTNHKSVITFNNRKKHNNRKTNHPQYKYKDNEFLNIVKVINKNAYKKIEQRFGNQESIAIVKDKLNNQIQSYKCRVKKYNKEIDKLNGLLIFESDDVKITDINKKISKKQKTVDKNKNKILELKSQYDEIIVPREKGKSSSKSYTELTMEITALPTNLLRNKAYGAELLQMVEDYLLKLINTGLNMDIHSYSLHLDQNGMPHIHTLLSTNESDMTFDKFLKSQYEWTEAKYQLNVDFNTFVKEHQICKDYDLEIDQITKGGKSDYLPINIFNSITKQSKKDVEKLFKRIEDKSQGTLMMDKDKHIQLLKQQLLNNYIKVRKYERTRQYLFRENKNKDEKIQELQNLVTNQIVNFENEFETKVLKIKELLKEKTLEINRLKNIDKNINNIVKNRILKVERVFQSKLDELMNKNSTLEDENETLKNFIKNKDLLQDYKEYREISQDFEIN